MKNTHKKVVKIKKRKASKKSPISRNYLKDIEIEVNEKGFVIWVNEKTKTGGKLRMIKHWVVDGSLLKENGIIRFGTPDLYKIEARYDKKQNMITIGRK